MINIRRGTFETSSSSVHAIVVVDDGTYADFMDGKVFVGAFDPNSTDGALYGADVEIEARTGTMDQMYDAWYGAGRPWADVDEVCAGTMTFGTDPAYILSPAGDIPEHAFTDNGDGTHTLEFTVNV